MSSSMSPAHSAFRALGRFSVTTPTLKLAHDLNADISTFNVFNVLPVIGASQICLDIFIAA